MKAYVARYEQPMSMMGPAPSHVSLLHAQVWPITWSRGFHVVTSASDSQVHGWRPAGSELIQFHLQLEGESTLAGACNASIVCPARSSAVLLHPANSDIGWALGTTEGRFVSLLCTCSFLRRLLASGPGDPDDLVREVQAIGGGLLRFNPAAAAAAQDLLSCESRQGLNRLRAEAKAIELLCALLDTILEPSARPELPIVLSDRDINRLHQARDMITTRLSVALTIPQLARAVGLNQQKLKVGFKHLFGQTIFDYATGARMSEALRLVTSEVTPISVIAARVGYRCAASFSRAFERYHGCAPRAARKRGGNVSRGCRNSIA